MSTTNKNLTGYWSLNNTSTQGNKKIVTDASGKNRHGELKGDPVLVTDNKFGKVLQLDGVNDYVAVPGALTSTNFTLSLWMKGALAATILNDQSISANEWRFYAWTGIKGGKEGGIYQNGIFKSVAIQEHTTSLAKLPIAGNNQQPSAFLAGQIAHIRSFDKVLTPEEVKSVMRADEVAEETFRRTHPLAFELLNDHQQSVLTLDGSARNLDMVVRNTSARTIEWETGTAPASAANHHLHLQIRPGTLSTNVVIATTDTANWNLAPVKEKNGVINVYLLRKTALSLATQQETSIALTGFLPDATQGTRGSQLQFVYQKMHYNGDANSTLKGSRQGHLLVSNRKTAVTPFEAVIANSNHILNDGSTNDAYQLKIRLKEALTIKKGNNEGDATASRFILSFPEESQLFALATKAQVANINITTTDNKWEIPKNTQGTQTEWILYYKGDNDLKLDKGAVLNLTIGGIVTTKPTGSTYLNIRHVNIPAFGDYTLTVPLKKTPLMFGGTEQKSVGIGTNAPSGQLNVYKSGGATTVVLGNPQASTGGFASLTLGTKGDKDASAYLQAVDKSGTSFGSLLLNLDGGNVGIGTSSPSQKLHVEGTSYLNGNVGIGTSSPTASLDVKGSLHLNGSAPIQIKEVIFKKTETKLDSGYKVRDWVIIFINQNGFGLGRTIIENSNDLGTWSLSRVSDNTKLNFVAISRSLALVDTTEAKL